MLDRFVIYVEKPPNLSVRDGMVHVEDASGSIVFRRVMPISVFLHTLHDANRIMADWRIDQSGKVERLDDWREGHAALP